jgi:hypothetical protein
MIKFVLSSNQYTEVHSMEKVGDNGVCWPRLCRSCMSLCVNCTGIKPLILSIESEYQSSVLGVIKLKLTLLYFL